MLAAPTGTETRHRGADAGLRVTADIRRRAATRLVPRDALHTVLVVRGVPSQMPAPVSSEAR